MSATDELRRLLDERGVEYFTDDDERAYDEPARTTWDFVLCGYEMTVTVTEFVDIDGKTYLEMDFHHAFTPEQAIAATLGGGELTKEDVQRALFAHSTYANYDGLQLYASGIRTQEIADELNAALGGGECEVECFDDGVDEGTDGEWFSYATPTWYLSCGHEVKGTERPNYCVVCGKWVKR